MDMIDLNPEVEKAIIRIAISLEKIEKLLEK